jgi:hypothetical protein
MEFVWDDALVRSSQNFIENKAFWACLKARRDRKGSTSKGKVWVCLYRRAVATLNENRGRKAEKSEFRCRLPPLKAARAHSMLCLTVVCRQCGTPTL